jgi:hypothetical protein
LGNRSSVATRAWPPFNLASRRRFTFLLVSALSACFAIGEDPLPSIPYFEQLMWAADYPNELIELGYFDDIFYLHDLTEQRTHADGARLGSLHCYSG